MNFKLHNNIYYYPENTDNNERKMLDLYLPIEKENFPVVFFIHAGGWQYGSKERFANIGETFSKLGMGVVVMNYRLSPAVMHPAHIEDVAMAFHWVYTHIEHYGGNKKKICLFGYSAGAHLGTLLFFNTKYLEKFALSSDCISSMVCISGVYNISEPMSMEELFKIPAFGTSTADWDDASPILFVKKTDIPIVLIYAENDEESTKNQTFHFFNKLKEKESNVKLIEIKGRDHFQMLDTIENDDDQIKLEILNLCK